MGQLWAALSFLVPGGNQANIQSEHLDARKLEQDRVISELKSMDQCIYCYLDVRLEILLLPLCKQGISLGHKSGNSPYH